MVCGLFDVCTDGVSGRYRRASWERLTRQEGHMSQEVAAKRPNGPFSADDVGKTIVIKGGQVQIDGVHRDVQ